MPKKVRKVRWEEELAGREEVGGGAAAAETDKKTAVVADLPHGEVCSLPKETKQEIKPRVEAFDEVAIAQANGTNGQIQLFEDRVRLGREGFGARMMLGVRGDREVLLSRISSVDFQPVGRFVDGYIQFVLVGEQEAEGVTSEPVGNENRVTFTRSQQAGFERLYLAIRQRIGRLMAGEAKEAPSDLEYLERLASLRDKRIITEEEFNAKKRQILGL
jgi:hypothetical protein